MSTPKHTPGPWTLERDRAKSLSLYSGSVFIGEVYHEVDEPSTQEQANANLIAAAPAMYEALHVLCREIQGAVSIENGIVSFLDGGYLDINPILAQAEGK